MWAPSNVSEAMTVVTPRVSDLTVLTVLTPEDSICPLSKSPKCACCCDEPCSVLCFNSCGHSCTVHLPHFYTYQQMWCPHKNPGFSLQPPTATCGLPVALSHTTP